jgi:hypothetical protein
MRLTDKQIEAVIALANRGIEEAAIGLEQLDEGEPNDQTREERAEIKTAEAAIEKLAAELRRRASRPPRTTGKPTPNRS